MNQESAEAAYIDPPEVPAWQATSTYRMVGDMGPLFAAKAKARRSFGPIERTREVMVYPKQRADGYKPPPYKFVYAELADVRRACDPALSDNGLDCFHIACVGPDGEREIHAFLAHASGAYIEAVLPLRDVGGWQEFGSALTYAERYTYVALVGVASERDDDGNQADGNEVTESRDKRRREPPAPPKAAPAPQRPQEPVSPPQAATPAPAPQKPASVPPVKPATIPPPPPDPTAKMTKAQKDELMVCFEAIGITASAPTETRVKGQSLCRLIVPGWDSTKATVGEADQLLSVMRDKAKRDQAWAEVSQ